MAGLQRGAARDGQRHAVAIVPLAVRTAGRLHVLECRLLHSHHIPTASQKSFFGFYHFGRVLEQAGFVWSCTFIIRDEYVTVHMSHSTTFPEATKLEPMVILAELWKSG